MAKLTKVPHLQRRRSALLALSALPVMAGIGTGTLPRSARAQIPEPVLGTPGKDSGWIPTPEGMVEAMLEMAEVGPGDTVVDLGSGDGRIPILAAKRYGAQGLGIEFNGDLVRYSESVAQKEGLAARVKFIQGDIFAQDFSHATVVTLFMPPDFNRKVRPTLLAMKPGTRVVAFNFDMADWPPDESVYVNYQRGMLWRVPANLAGNWRLAFEPQGTQPAPPPHVLQLRQRFQKVEGELMLGSERLTLWDLRLEVDRLRFAILHDGRRRDFDIRLSGNRLEGRMEAAGQPARRFAAARNT
jgi:SAM-dependent methyltransferase